MLIYQMIIIFSCHLGQIGRDIRDSKFKLRGLTGQSELRVLPSTDGYYREYTCRANNRVGGDHKVTNYLMDKQTKDKEEDKASTPN